MHVNDTGTEIMTSTGNIHTILAALNRRGGKKTQNKKIIMLLSAKTFSSVKSQGDISLPQKTRSLVHLLLGHSNIAEKLQFAANHLKQRAWLHLKLLLQYLLKRTFIVAVLLWDTYCIFLKR